MRIGKNKQWELRGAVNETGARMNGSDSNHLEHAFGKIVYHRTLGFLKQDYRDGLACEAPFYSGYELAAGMDSHVKPLSVQGMN